MELSYEQISFFLALKYMICKKLHPWTGFIHDKHSKRHHITCAAIV